MSKESGDKQRGRKKLLTIGILKLEQLNQDYQPNGYIDEPDSGLGLRVYHRRQDDLLTVLVAFRGTDGAENKPDMLSNFSWFTQWFRDNDQYKRACAL